MCLLGEHQKVGRSICIFTYVQLELGIVGKANANMRYHHSLEAGGTQTLRLALRRYRSFFDRLLSF